MKKTFSKNEYWFVLTPETLSWFKDDSEQDKKYMIQLTGKPPICLEIIKLIHSLDDLKVRSDEQENMFGSKTIKFTIFSSNRKNIYQNNSKLDLVCHSVDELESWKASLLRAGVYPEVNK